MAELVPMEEWIQELLEVGAVQPNEASILQMQWDEMPDGEMLYLPQKAALFRMPAANLLPL
jgi:hypothetical protein